MGNTYSLGDSILFPAPTTSYDSKLPNLIWINESYIDSSAIPPPPDSARICSGGDGEICSVPIKDESRLFPALFFSPAAPTQHTLLYWHGNSCDLGQISEELQILSAYLKCNVCGIEFPGYGLRRDLSPTGQVIDAWGRAAFNYLTLFLGIPSEGVLCFGRSIGTGPACKLACELKKEGILIGGLVLHAPYISVHKIVKDYSALGTWVISNYWDNSLNLSDLSPDCPLLIVHGLDDEVIPTYHGRDLHDSYVSDVKVGCFPADSSHNAYYIIDDIARPLQGFLMEKSRSRKSEHTSVKIPPSACVAPRHLSGLAPSPPPIATASSPAPSPSSVVGSVIGAAGTTTSSPSSTPASVSSTPLKTIASAASLFVKPEEDRGDGKTEEAGGVRPIPKPTDTTSASTASSSTSSGSSATSTTTSSSSASTSSPHSSSPGTPRLLDTQNTQTHFTHNIVDDDRLHKLIHPPSSVPSSVSSSSAGASSAAASSSASERSSSASRRPISQRGSSSTSTTSATADCSGKGNGRGDTSGDSGTQLSYQQLLEGGLCTAKSLNEIVLGALPGVAETTPTNTISSSSSTTRKDEK